MDAPPIPERIPPLTWREPAFFWTPLALALALAAPIGLFFFDRSLIMAALIALIAAFVLALAWLGLKWARGRPPKARRLVVEAVVTSALVIAIIGPFVQFATYALRLEHAWPLVLFALMLGLPLALISGTLFAWTALDRPPGPGEPGPVLDDGAFRSNFQPFK
jgi:hypothetical protein